MTLEQIKDAIEQMKSHCDLNTPSYNYLSARSTLYALGYEMDDADEILQVIYDGGFRYCLDYRFKCSDGVTGKEIYPRPDVCYWGPDQLKSRLQSIYIPMEV